MAPHHALVDREIVRLCRGQSPYDVLLVTEPPRHGKALADDTPIPTPTGWTAIGSLKPGDWVYAEDGSPTRVLSVRHWTNRPLYLATTDDGQSLLADAEHEWLVRLCRKRKRWAKHTTATLAARKSPRAAAIPICLPIEGVPIPLAVAPYVLGVWLGDGHRAQGTISCGESDIAWLRAKIESYGYQTSDRKTPQTFGVLGLRGQLASLGVLFRKAIPPHYQRATEADRRQLLQGLIDTDGHVSRDGQVEFTSISRPLAESVAELVHGLGVKASLIEGRATLNGRDIGPKYRVMFYMDGAAAIPRKAGRCRNGKRTPHRFVTFRPAGSGPTTCIQVEHPSHLFLAGRGFLVTHNSEHVSHYTPAWHVTQFPDDWVGVGSYSANLAKEFGTAARDTFCEAAPHFGMRLNRGRAAADLWGAAGHRGGMRATGVGGSWTGKGFKLLDIDDPIKDSEEALSDRFLDKQWDWFLSTARTRLEPGGKIIIMQTRWSVRDLTGRILAGEMPGYRYRHINLPALAEAGDELGRAIGEPLWPGRWPLEELEKIRGGAEGDYWWYALYQGRPKQHARASFPDSYFEDVYARDWPDHFELAVIFADPVTDAEKGDDAGIVFAGLSRGKVYIDADVRRIPASELADAVINMAATYRPDEICFESNNFQSLLAGEFDRFIERNGFIAWPITGMENFGVKKQVRIARLGGPLRVKQLRFRPGSPGVERLLRQLKTHPFGDYDDGPDALECALRRLQVLAAGYLEGTESAA